MQTKFLLFLLLISLADYCFSQEPLINNVYNRATTSLNGKWKYIVDPYENGYYNYRYEAFDQQKHPSRSAYYRNAKPKNKRDRIEYDFDKCDSLSVPGDWNTQKEKLYFYEGTLWYKKSFDYTLAKTDNRLFVYFGAANYKTEVYLNGVKLGTHIGGFTPFNFELTSLLKEKDNFLIVKVDNKRTKEGVPTHNTDWWNYGGITRAVKLVETPAEFIQDYFIQLDPEDKNKISGYVSLSGQHVRDKMVKLSFPELGISKTLRTDSLGRSMFIIETKNLSYWSLGNPKLYAVELSTSSDVVEDKIGFRTIETSGHDILLNGKSIFLKGISIHEESPLRDGRAHSIADAKQLLEWAKELGCNYVRLAHYPHNEHMVRLADQLGMLVWEENPVYWTIEWENESTYLNAQNQLTEVIRRDKNRASVIIWSMANETPTSKARNLFLNRLAKLTRKLDPTRLISAALEQKDYIGLENTRTISDPFKETVDILSFNQYIGWYDGLTDKCKTIKWKIDENKPVLISEFGAGAKQGYHADKETIWSEEYQEELYKETLKMIDKIPQLRGVSPWILVDFRSPRRHLPGIQDNWNRKGLISDEGLKKKAFNVLKKYYLSKG